SSLISSSSASKSAEESAPPDTATTIVSSATGRSNRIHSSSRFEANLESLALELGVRFALLFVIWNRLLITSAAASIRTSGRVTQAGLIRRSGRWACPRWLGYRQR